TIDFPNFTSAGHSAQLRAVLSTLRQRIEGKLTAPWTFGVPVRTRVDLSWEDRPEPLTDDYSFRAEEARAAVTFSRPIIGDLRGFLGYETTSTRVFDATDAFLTQTSIGTGADATVPDLRLSALSVGWELDGRDNRFNPRTGAYATMRYTFAHSDLGGNVDFHRLEGTIAMYYSAGPFTLALRSDSAAVDYDSSEDFSKLPPPFRVFTGGARSVRSFPEGELGPLTIADTNGQGGGSPLGGLGYGVVNLELRTTLWQYEDTPFGVSLLLFADAGSVWPYSEESDLMVPGNQDPDRYRTRATDVAFALGWGLRFDTFIGPIGFHRGTKTPSPSSSRSATPSRERVMSFDAWLKAFHLLGVIFWIGPLLGGWWMVARADASGNAETIRWARKAFLPLVHLEHLGLVVWLTFGLWMAMRMPYTLTFGWMHAKLAIVGGVIVPLELWDMVVSHVLLPRALRAGDDAAADAAIAKHRMLCKVSVMFLIPAVIGIVVLAVARPF
ncbi:MAG: BamA/TamA family outer membrane protein, partial [Planctomycetota bacterium]